MNNNNNNNNSNKRAGARKLSNIWAISTKNLIDFLPRNKKNPLLLKYYQDYRVDVTKTLLK